MRGKFITFEGGEGAGKSTQIAKLSAYLTAKNIPNIITREPGGNDSAELIRNLLVKGATDRWNPITELLLMFASRADHWHKRIKPSLDNNIWVLCDRFADSSTAYQGYGHGIDQTFIKELYKQSVGAQEPDITFIFDIDPVVGLKRSQDRLSAHKSDENRFESLNTEFHERIRNGFLEIAKNHPHRCHIIDAEQDIDTLFSEIIESLEIAPA